MEELNIVSDNLIQTQIIKKSKFIAYIFDANKDSYQAILKQLKREHLSATHICYAYRFCASNLDDMVSGELDITQGYFDDGEPSGTAGAPILKSILDNNIVNTLVAVVRYFGGVKLGASGLIKAYKTSADMVTKQATRPILKAKIYSISLNYSQFNSLNSFLTNNSIKLLEKNFDDNVVIKIALTNLSDLNLIKGYVLDKDIVYLGEKFI